MDKNAREARERAEQKLAATKASRSEVRRLLAAADRARTIVLALDRR